jgi:predicted RNA-binding Zn-ribbon protein involved in translation (DUF1610 family)
MGLVIPFAPRERRPRLAPVEACNSGPAKCVACGYEFEARTEPGVMFFFCPDCFSERATWRHTLYTADEPAECSCGSDVWRIEADSGYTYCPNCGLAKE